MRRRLAGALLALAGLLATAGAATPAVAGSRHDGGFVVRKGDRLFLDGRPFRFAGTNNYYLEYKSRPMVDDVFADAKAAGFTVLRHWGFLDIGNADDSNSVSGKSDGVYLQYWDGTKPAYNDGPDGLQRLDYVLYAARRAGIKVVVPLTNNWRDFGGMDQYVRWRGGTYHDDFYTDPVIRGWYRDWVSHVLDRVNPLTGVAYKDDPTVMAWELANEPRCKGSGVYPTSPTCSTSTLTTWADEMSRHVKAVDRRHLVGVGDEGFFCDDRAATDWTVNCGEGVDTVALASLPAVDLMGYHLYPDHWDRTADWGVTWIERHSREAEAIGKPVLLGEFGWADKATRNPVYRRWTDAVIRSGGDGFLYWILSGTQDDGSLYPDYDGYTVYCPSPVCTTLGNAADAIRGDRRPRPPVADHDTATTQAGTPVTLTPTSNDIAYAGQVRPSTVDLDPSAYGQQRVATVAGGAFALSAGGAVVFTPADGFQGKATGHYTVRDAAGRVSNVADLTVTVKPAPRDPIRLASWETGVEGWAPGSWQTDAGSVAQTASFATEGTHGLEVAATGGGWFGVTLPAPVDLSAKATLKYDLRTSPAAGTSTAIALQTGSGFAWCQSTFGWVGQGTTTTVEVDLLNQMSCDAAALADVRGVLIWVSPGTHDLDNLRAE
ncbi:cellulase family glycosylhydrolase [Micromonospora auratinigra]|uniref:mannan endo-1,4-beta-mannosidase n=1 Tax=Micromonospora auratinigra TaxID=261654 RepID=A0A1A9AA08_9ACTN|nr:cellulase family glycosylhydrolase [Micromonospora auratinigra]SBT52970.1 mannan endo-1,4-beta-mannosidase [Micromonospora auratinigra]